MKTTIKKQVTQEIEIDLPLYFKKRYNGVCAIYSESRMAIVHGELISISEYKPSIINQLSDYTDGMEISKSEFDAEYKRVLNKLASFEL